MKAKGKVFFLEVEVDYVYVILAAMRTTSLTLNNELVDVTEKGAVWRELLDGCGVRSVTIKAQGCISDAAAYKTISTYANTGLILNAKIKSDGTDIHTGGFIVSGFETSGEYRRDGLYAITLERASDEIIRNERLLEDGSFRLLETGFRRLLESEVA